MWQEYEQRALTTSTKLNATEIINLNNTARECRGESESFPIRAHSRQNQYILNDLCTIIVAEYFPREGRRGGNGSLATVHICARKVSWPFYCHELLLLRQQALKLRSL